MHLSADEVLTQCSNCGAWPMATKAVETGVSWGRLIFRCPRCHRDETRSISGGAAAAR
jgi:Zn finger protein HypA/HybF involved in hydrogenase expression